MGIPVFMKKSRILTGTLISEVRGLSVHVLVNYVSLAGKGGGGCLGLGVGDSEGSVMRRV